VRVFIPSEIRELPDYGVSRIYSRADVRNMGLGGMFKTMLEVCDYMSPKHLEQNKQKLATGERQAIARLITYVENSDDSVEKADLLRSLQAESNHAPVLGI